MVSGRRKRFRGVLGSPMAAPIIGMLAAFCLAPLIRYIDQRTGWSLFNYTPDGARAVLSSLVPALLTFIVFVFTFLLLAVQVASAQLSPRIIARTFSGKRVRLCLGVFVFTFTYSLAALGRVEQHVPQLPVLIAALSSLANLLLFIDLVQSAAQQLRPITVMTNVASETYVVIKQMYPQLLSDEAKDLRELPRRVPDGPTRTLLHAKRSAVLLSFDKEALVKLAGDGV